MASHGSEEFLIRFMTHISGQHFIHLRLDWYRYMGVKWAAPGLWSRSTGFQRSKLNKGQFVTLIGSRI